eukprot:57824_1
MSNCGKTSVWRLGLDLIGQESVLLETERNGWFQNFNSIKGTYYVGDGFCKKDIEQGLNASWFEDHGDGIPHIMPQRNLTVQPKTDPKKPAYFTANNHPSQLFGQEIWKSKLAARCISIQVSTECNLFDLINILRVTHDIPELPPHDPMDNQRVDMKLPL